MTSPDRSEMQLHRCLVLIHFPSHEHTLYCWSSSPALRKPSAAAGTTVRREERGKYLLFVADCVFLSPLLSSRREAPCFCLPVVPRVAPALWDGKGQEEECEPGLEVEGSGQHPGQGRTRRPCSALPCLSFFPLPHLPSSGSRLMGSLGWAASRCGTTLLCLATCTGSFLLLLKSKQCCGCVRRCSEAVA